MSYNTMFNNIIFNTLILKPRVYNTQVQEHIIQ